MLRMIITLAIAILAALAGASPAVASAAPDLAPATGCSNNQKDFHNNPIRDQVVEAMRQWCNVNQYKIQPGRVMAWYPDDSQADDQSFVNFQIFVCNNNQQIEIGCNVDHYLYAEQQIDAQCGQNNAGWLQGFEIPGNPNGDNTVGRDIRYFKECLETAQPPLNKVETS